ncbi:hypothetical protein DPMN_182708 [Dreissena polymorpha]|uniref:Uncharacterized protein n=1 Tax=Dreissena polymorpha TaxID=45954 RepID=A0A9D4DF62_DREPO|nr:hypothetical protein DPMN_182637 [Dreissena polymorpha]KAH3748270.1 hypothetical protein DPMN_182708 [Dreissena polymorpha]
MPVCDMVGPTFCNAQSTACNVTLPTRPLLQQVHLYSSTHGCMSPQTIQGEHEGPVESIDGCQHQAVD